MMTCMCLEIRMHHVKMKASFLTLPFVLYFRMDPHLSGLLFLYPEARLLSLWEHSLLQGWFQCRLGSSLVRWGELYQGHRGRRWAVVSISITFFIWSEDVYWAPTTRQTPRWDKNTSDTGPRLQGDGTLVWPSCGILQNKQWGDWVCVCECTCARMCMELRLTCFPNSLRC